MDPLSGVASVIAVVSLSLQIAGSVDNACRFFRSIRNAPVELQRLLERLDLLNCLLKDVAQALTHSENLPQMPETPASLSRTLKSCESQLSILQPIIRKTEDVFAKTGKIERSWASLKLTLKKRDIEEYEQQMQRTISELQTALLLYSMGVQHVHYQQTLSLCIGSNTPTRPPLPLSVHQVTSYNGNSKQVSNVMSSSTPLQTVGFVTAGTCSVVRQWSYDLPGVTLHSRIVCHQKTSDYKRNDKSRTVEKKGVFQVVSKVLHYCVDFQWSWSHKLSCQLQAYPVLPYDHELFNQCDGTLRNLQLYLQKHKLSPFTVNQWGETLLDFCLTNESGENSLQICKFLLSEGLSPNSRNTRYANFPTPLHSLACYRYLEDWDTTCIVDTVRLISSNPQFDWDFNELCRFARHYKGPADGLTILFSEMSIDEQFILSEDPESIQTLVHELLSSFGQTREPDCAGLLENLLRQYQVPLSSRMLDDLFSYGWDPFDSCEVGRVWLEVVTKLGADVKKYLEEAIQSRRNSILSCYGSNWYPLAGQIKRFIIASEPVPTVCWEWWIPTDGPAAAVLGQFANLGVCHPNSLCHEDVLLHWPFNFSKCFPHPEEEDVEVVRGMPFYFEHMERQIDITTQRRLRRERKNEAKQRKLAGLGKWPIPGSWIP